MTDEGSNIVTFQRKLSSDRAEDIIEALKLLAKDRKVRNIIWIVEMDTGSEQPNPLVKTGVPKKEDTVAYEILSGCNEMDMKDQIFLLECLKHRFSLRDSNLEEQE